MRFLAVILFLMSFLWFSADFVWGAGLNGMSLTLATASIVGAFLVPLLSPRPMDRESLELCDEYERARAALEPRPRAE